MKRENYEAWLKALRSRRYRQGTKKLYDVNTQRYCALGVLEEVGTYGRPIEFDLPSSVLEEVIDMNDNLGCSFFEIAD